jgi:glucose/arabinose dehydrogenase
MGNQPGEATDRRDFLKYGGALSVTALAGCAGNGDPATTTDAGPTTTKGGVAETFELEAITGGWEGTAPSSIGGTTNPTLALEAGERYRVIWTNGDGAPHDFVVLDADGNRLVGTDVYDTQGETQELEFEATEAMTQYYCSIHPNTMRGRVDIAGVSQPTATEGVTLIEEGPTVRVETVAEGLASPTAMVVAPGRPDERYIIDQPGVVYVHDEDGIREFIDVSEKIVTLQEGFDERGLLGMAFHPRYGEGDNRRFYLRYSAPATADTPEDWDHQSILAEYEASDDLSEGLVETERIVLEYPNPQFNHNAGPIAFGPDGYLYVATGDGGNAHDIGTGHVADWYADNEGGNGQDTVESLLGGILRIDVDEQDEGLEYAIPEDNPLVGMDGHRDEYYAWGFRNPWGMDFEAETDELLVADVGQGLLEYVNRVEMGANYGWNVKEGTHCFSPETPSLPPEDCPQETPADVRGGNEPLLDPIVEYPQFYDTQSIGSAIVGGDMYRGSELSELQDTYVFADWSGEYAGRIMVAYPPEKWPEETVPERDLQNQTDGHDSEVFDEEQWDGLWPIDELAIAADDEALLHDDAQDRLADFVLSVDRDGNGDLYVLTNSSAGPTGDGGKVLKIVQPE